VANIVSGSVIGFTACVKAYEKHFESILTDVRTREEHASSIGAIYHVSHASRHAHRDLSERHRTSDLNRITRTFVITRRGNAYTLSIRVHIVGASTHKRLLGFHITQSCCRSFVPERDLHQVRI